MAHNRRHHFGHRSFGRIFFRLNMLALVLARKNFRESDQMVSLLTRERGKVEVLAKGIKKIISKNSSNLKVLSLVEAEIAQGKEVDYLTKVQPVTIFKNIYLDFDKVFLAGYIAKIVDANILGSEPDEEIFNLLVSFLEFLNSAEKINSLNLATGFILKFWHCLGFGMEDGHSKLWLESDWRTINDFKLREDEQLRTYQSACEYAQVHSGQKLARLVSIR